MKASSKANEPFFMFFITQLSKPKENISFSIRISIITKPDRRSLKTDAETDSPRIYKSDIYGIRKRLERTK